MKNLFKSFGLVVMLTFGANSAKAQGTPELCAADLTPTGQAIYEAVAPYVEADSNLKKLIKKKVRPLVMKGELKRKDAKANAPLAGECLLIIKQAKAAASQ